MIVALQRKVLHEFSSFTKAPHRFLPMDVEGIVRRQGIVARVLWKRRPQP